jgi:hypothetical protein
MRRRAIIDDLATLGYPLSYRAVTHLTPAPAHTLVRQTRSPQVRDYTLFGPSHIFVIRVHAGSGNARGVEALCVRTRRMVRFPGTTINASEHTSTSRPFAASMCLWTGTDGQVVLRTGIVPGHTKNTWKALSRLLWAAFGVSMIDSSLSSFVADSATVAATHVRVWFGDVSSCGECVPVLSKSRVTECKFNILQV